MSEKGSKVGLTAKQEKALGVAFGLVILGSFAFFIADNVAHVSVERFLLEHWPLRFLLTVVSIAVVGFFGYFFWVAIVLTYVGDGDWKKGFLKFAVSAVAAWFFIAGVHQFTFWLWEAGPTGNQYEAVDQRYSDLCTTQEEVDYGQWETDVDWHAGDGVCAPLERRLHRLYPGPVWLFGQRPGP